MARVRIEIWDNGDNIQQAEAEHIDPREAFERAVRMARAALPKEETGPKLNAGSYAFEMKNVQFTDVTKQLLFMDAEGRKRAQSFDVRVVGGGGDGRCPKMAPGRGRGNRCTKDGGHFGQHVGEVDGWRWSDPDPTPTQAGEARSSCGESCPTDDAGHPPCSCELHLGHDGKHRSHSTGHGWPRKPCGESCQDTDGACARPQGHDDWHITADGACTWPRRAEPPCHLVCTVDDNCWAECAKAKGHEGEHRCRKVHRSEMPKSRCSMICDKANPDCYERCVRAEHHDGDCWCEPAHNESLCLNEIGAPSATRNCHQPRDHEGHCDGEEDTENVG